MAGYSITIISREVTDDIRSAAWLESELHEDFAPHRRHEMADICEEGNIDRIWRVFGLCDAEIRVALRRILADSRPPAAGNTIDRPDKWTYILAEGVSNETASLAKEKIHDYFTASALADRAEVIIPECAPIWKERARDALAELEQCSATAINGRRVRRRMCPF